MRLRSLAVLGLLLAATAGYARPADDGGPFGLFEKRIVAAEQMAGLPPGVPVYRIPPGEYVASAMGAVPLDADEVDWGHGPLGAAECWKTTRGKGVKVAVLDTGCDMNHVDLKAQVIASKDFTGSRNGASDVQGHGTFCAGEIAAAENGVGTIGFAPECQIIVAKVLSDGGSGATTWINAGGDWAVAQGADVISMSLGGPSPDSQSAAAVKRWTEAGVIVCAAAGNEGPGNNTVGYPGGFPECVCVGAVGSNLSIASFSSRGSPLYACGPGVNIRAPLPGNRTGTMSGTSMSTPYLAAVAALWIASHPEIPKKERPAKFKESLKATVRDLGPAGRDTAYGYGFAQPVKMMGPVQPPPVIPPTPVPGGGFTGSLVYQDGRLVGVNTGVVVPPKPPAVADTVEIDLTERFNRITGPFAERRKERIRNRVMGLITDSGIADVKEDGDKLTLTRKPAADPGQWAKLIMLISELITQLMDLIGGLKE